MLFKAATLAAIVEGRITLAFRRWRRPTVRAGGSLRTAAGVVRFGVVQRVEPEAISEEEARAAGFQTRQALLDHIGIDQSSPVYRVEIVGLAPDPRSDLQLRSAVTGDELVKIAARLQRWDRVKQCLGWHRRALRLIADKPAVPARTLAAEIGCETAPFKRDIRKLKDLGLTESLDVGYRLSPRGDAVLKGLEEMA